MALIPKHTNTIGLRKAMVMPTLGGVAAKTREAMLLCEAAGYDVVIVETGDRIPADGTIVAIAS